MKGIKLFILLFFHLSSKFGGFQNKGVEKYVYTHTLTFMIATVKRVINAYRIKTGRKYSKMSTVTVLSCTHLWVLFLKIFIDFIREKGREQERKGKKL